MKFVKIATPTKTTVEELFTLGVSTSKGTENIGQFGSGTLMSTLLWLRRFNDSPAYFVNGEKVVFKSETGIKSNGDFYDKIIMMRGRKRREMSVSLEYGEKDWTDVSMAMREWISNALDQGKEISNCVEVVDKIVPGDGVEVYVKLTPEVKEYIARLSDNFLHAKNEQGSKTIAKTEPSSMKLYRRGVFIREFEKKSIFDYNLDFDITENRNGSSDSMMYQVSQLIRGWGYHNEEYTKTVWENVLSKADVVEVNDLEDYHSLMGDWSSVLQKETRKVYPISAMILGMEGMEGIPIRDAWYHQAVTMNPSLDGMKNCGTAAKRGFIGVKTAEGKPHEMMTRLHNIIWASGLDNGRTELPKLEVYKTADGSEPSIRGYYDKDSDTIGIYQGNQLDQRVMLEEMAHRCSGHSDRTRKFQDYLVALASNVIGETEV